MGKVCVLVLWNHNIQDGSDWGFAEAGAFDLVLGHDLKLIVLPAESGGSKCGESWRLFAPSMSQAHFVFCGENEEPNNASEISGPAPSADSSAHQG